MAEDLAATFSSSERVEERPTQPLRPDKSLGELLAEMSSELGTLFTKEVELAKVELRDDAKRAGRGATMLGIAGVAGWMTVLFVSFAAAWLIDQSLNTPLSFLIVGAVWAVVAVVAASTGRSRLRQLEGVPQTKQTLKEDAQWVKAQRS